MRLASCRAVAVCGGLALVLGAVPAFADWAKGVEAFNKKDYAAAAAAFEAVTKESPSYAGAYYMLGLAQNGLGQRSPALASLRKAVDLSGQEPSYRIALAQVLVKADQFQEAYAALEPLNLTAMEAKYRTSYALLFAQAAAKSGHGDAAARVITAQSQADPRNANLQQALGVLYDAQGDDKKAFAAFRKAYELGPTAEVGRSAVRSGIATARRAVSDQEKTSTYAAAAAVAERLATSADSFEHALLAGEAWLGAKEYDKALGWFSKAQARQSQNALVRFYKGQCYSSQGKFDQSIAELREALNLLKGLGVAADAKLRKQIHETMGYVYAKQKDYDKARGSYQEAGNSGKVREMEDAQAKAAQNKAAEAEREQYLAKIVELEKKIAELDRLGASNEANALRGELDNMRKALGPS